MCRWLQRKKKNPRLCECINKFIWIANECCCLLDFDVSGGFPSRGRGNSPLRDCQVITCKDRRVFLFYPFPNPRPNRGSASLMLYESFLFLVLFLVAQKCFINAAWISDFQSSWLRLCHRASPPELDLCEQINSSRAKYVILDWPPSFPSISGQGA